MRNQITLAIALLLYCSAASAAAVPEIDGALSVQAFALIAAVAYLLKRKK